MLLQFTSASLTNYRGDHAKGAHGLKGDQTWFRGATLRLATAHQAPHLLIGALVAGMLLFQGYLPPHKAVVIGQGAIDLN